MKGSFYVVLVAFAIALPAPRMENDNYSLLRDHPIETVEVVEFDGNIDSVETESFDLEMESELISPQDGDTSENKTDSISMVPLSDASPNRSAWVPARPPTPYSFVLETTSLDLNTTNQ
jgi:hypothetical protein